MHKQLVLIKFGGSLITYKDQEDTARYENIEFCADEMRQVYKAQHDTHFIIGTGGGSFAHVKAHEYNLKEGAKTAQQLYGMCSTHNNVRKLNGIVADNFTRVGIPAFTLSPASLLMANNGVVDSAYAAPVVQLLKSDCIPMVHGDTILDVARGTTLFSTEKVLQVCLEELRSMYREIVVVYCMDIGGIADENGKIISKIARDEALFIHRNANRDVTGGIEGKLKSARAAADVADRVYVISGKTRGAIMKAILNKRVGTRVV